MYLCIRKEFPSLCEKWVMCAVTGLQLHAFQVCVLVNGRKIVLNLMISKRLSETVIICFISIVLGLQVTVEPVVFLPFFFLIV